MSLTQSYAFSAKLFENIGYSHNIDPHTRLQIRLSSLDIVQSVRGPYIDWDMYDQEFIWLYTVERRITVPWETVTSAIQKAGQDFFAKCSIYRSLQTRVA